MQFKGKSALRLLALVCACLLAAAAAEARVPKHQKSGTRAKPAQKTTSKTTKKASQRRTVRKSSRYARRSRVRKPRGQQKIGAERTRQIQSALIRQHYLEGEASGQWDQDTKTAMARYQADHGWQTKVLPDSRALISLGLGPSQSNLLNPETAALPRAVKPVSPSATAMTSGSGIADEPQHR